jgi:hypothetical protein
LAGPAPARAAGEIGVDAVAATVSLSRQQQRLGDSPLLSR